MRKKIVYNKKAFEKMKEMYEAQGLTTIKTAPQKIEAFDKNGVKKHELVYHITIT